MAFRPFEVSTPHVAYACLGAFVVLFGMFSLFLREKLYIGEAIWAFVFGVIIGPYGANIFDPRVWGGGDDNVSNTITLEFCRVVLAIGVFAIGVELPKAYMKRHWKSLFFLLAPVMTWGWFVSAGFIYALVPGLNFVSSLAVAACLTPTDPILAAAVVGGKYADKHVPAHLRHLLAAESGCNDGAAFPFLYIALYIIIDHGNAGHVVRDWFLILWLYEVILGVAIGVTIGFSFRYLMKFCQRHDLIDRHSYVAQYVSLAVLTIGVTCLLGSDDLLSAFACGSAFAWDGFFNRQTEEAVFSSVIDLLFNIAAFIFVGAWMPFGKFQDAELTLTVWRLIVIAILVLLFKRLPVMIALYKWIPDVKTFREAIFSGHFGPIGIGAVFISTLAAQVLKTNELNAQYELLSEAIEPIVAFMVLCSIVIHGLSIPGFSLGRRVHSVSRTWSRHAPSGAPDWTNQARLVDRGDDIVINRDRDVVDGMERGELVVDDKVETDSTAAQSEITRKHGSGTGSGSHTPSPTPEAEVDAIPGSTPEHMHVASVVDEEEAAKEDKPPDGTDIISEWQEGPHRIIERRAGPGEEVDVEVIRNYGLPDSVRSRFHGSTGSVQEQVTDYVKSLGHRLQQHATAEGDDLLAHVDSLSRHLKARLAAAVASTEETAPSAPSSPRLPMSYPPPPQPHDYVDEEEEGWASDRTSASGSELPAVLDPRRRSKSPKIKAAGTKRRHSSRRGLVGQLMHSAKPPSSPPEEDRGRPTRFMHGPSLRNMRLEGVRSQHTPRELSPARSIRFADEGGTSAYNESANASRRASTIFNQGDPTSPLSDSMDSEGMSRSKVVFADDTK